MNADPLPSWSETAAKQSILEFIAAVTDPNSADFVPEVDRVAVFDNDGTISTEMPLYTQLAFALDRAAELGKPTSLEELQAAGLGAVLELVKLTHGSITTDEFDAVCRSWIASAQHPRFGRSYAAVVLSADARVGEPAGGAAASPAGSSPAAAQTSCGRGRPTVFGLAPHRLIGSVGTTEFRIGDAGPELVKGTDLQTLNDGPQKPISIHQHIGQRPLLAAGNTNGDLPMLQWTASNPYRTLQLVVHHTDGEREYAYDSDPLLGAGTDQLLAAASANHWSVIDMATDWTEVFGPEN